MRHHNFSFIHKFIILSILITCISSSKLNVPRVLLPIFSDFATKFTLEAVDGGCYKWSTTRKDIIKLELIDENIDYKCSSKVIVSTITKEQARNLAVVLAENIYTNHMLKCDVIVDVIHSLTITTTTRELFMEEVPEAFEVNAYDIHGNEFSTLEGVEFEWKIKSTGPNKHATILRSLQFKDSPYETPPHIELLESQNKKGYMILLEGVKTGSGKVSVCLPYSEYKHVTCYEVVLTVIANLLLTPGEVYIMVGDVISFKVFYMNSGRMEEIKLPDSQYYLEADNIEMALIRDLSNEMTALKEGKTNVILHNRNIDEHDPAVKLPSAVVNIVQPVYMLLNMLPFKNWAILVEDRHEITVEVFSSDDHKLHVGPGVKINTQVGKRFHVEEKSQNGSWITGWGAKESTATVWSTLDHVTHPKFGKFKLKTPIQTQSEISIYPRIVISPSEVILPWDPELKPQYNIDLVAKGGDGKFVWTSNDHSVGIVTQSGHVRTLSQGNFEITAAMSKNHHNRQFVKFSVVPPTRLEIVEYVMEAEIGAPIYLHIALYTEKVDGNGNVVHVPFTRCQDLPLQVKQTDNKFKQNKTMVIPPVGISCGNIAMVGTAVGTTKVTVSYYQHGNVLEDSVTISAYKPLRLFKPEDVVVLAVGTSINLVYTGGPQPVIGRGTDYQREIVNENAEIVLARNTTAKYSLPAEDITIVEALCLKLGESEIKLLISNKPTLPNCKSRAGTVKTKIICGKPRQIILLPKINVVDIESCPMDLSGDRAVVQNSQNVDIDVDVLDHMGRSFYNVSSFNFKWEAHPVGKATFISKNSVLSKNTTAKNVVVANKSYQSINAKHHTGFLEVKATITSYNQKVLKVNRIVSEYPEFYSDTDSKSEKLSLTTAISLYLVNSTMVTPNVTTIFNDPGNKRVISVKEGSGYYEIGLTFNDIATVHYIESSREIEISPNRAGELTIQVTDLCLSSKPAFIFVRVQYVKAIKVEMADRVEINRCIPCVVKLYDENDDLMRISDSDTVNIRFEFRDPVASLQKLPRNDLERGEIHYILTGNQLGDTTLIFSINNGADEIVSSPIDLQVFPALKLYPRNTTLLIGSTLQYTIRGGPQPDGNLEYNIDDSKVADVEKAGIVTGKTMGSSSITAKAVGVHPVTGNKIVYSQDTIDVNVIEIKGIKISAPLTRFKVGGTVPCWVSGIPEQITPMVLGNIKNPPVQFDWQVDDTNIAIIDGMFQTIGINYKNTDRVSIRLTGLRPGQTTVNVVVLMSGATANKPRKEFVKFMASLKIYVIEAFGMINPLGLSGNSLLIAPFSTLQLKTNLDTSQDVKYSLSGVSSKENNVDKSPILPSNIVSVSPSGFLKTHGILGHVMLLVFATDKFGLKQTMTFVVEVRPVHYMMLNVIAEWRIQSENILTTLPLGSEFKLKADFYDDVGNKFDAGPSNLKVRTSRCDLCQIRQKESVLHMAVQRSGHSVLKAQAGDADKTADYIKLHVEQDIRPDMDHVTTGDIICLWSPLVTETSSINFWNSSDFSLVSVNSDMQVAFVVGDRKGSVEILHSLHPAATIHLDVLPTSDIKMHNPGRIITNSESGSIFHVPLTLVSKKSPPAKKSNLIQGWRCKSQVLNAITVSHYKCYLAFTNTTTPFIVEDIFSVENSFIWETGQYSCGIISTGIHNPKISKIKTNLLVWAISGDEVIKSEPLELEFIPNVYVPEEVHLNEHSSAGNLDVIGLEDVLRRVRVEPADKSILFVGKGSFVKPTLLRFKLQLIDYHWRLADLMEAMGVIVISPMTDQNIKVMIRISGDKEKVKFTTSTPSSGFFSTIENYKHALIIILSIVGIFFLTSYVYFHYMQPTVQVNVHPNRSLLKGDPCQGNYPVSTSTPVNRSPRGFPHVCTNICNCTCGVSGEPVYGERSMRPCPTNTTDVRKSRRFV